MLKLKQVIMHNGGKIKKRPMNFALIYLLVGNE